jgi:hypothetical protein
MLWCLVLHEPLEAVWQPPEAIVARTIAPVAVRTNE